MKKMMMSILAATAVLAATTTMAFAGVEHSLTGVGGYDLVSYQTGEKPLPGNGNHVSEIDGVAYLFANADNQKTFEKNPARSTSPPTAATAPTASPWGRSSWAIRTSGRWSTAAST